MPGRGLSHHAKLKKNYDLAMCHCTMRKSERIFHLLSLLSFLLFILPLLIISFQFWRTDNHLVTGHISQSPCYMIRPYRGIEASENIVKSQGIHAQSCHHLELFAMVPLYWTGKAM